MEVVACCGCYVAEHRLCETNDRCKQWRVWWCPLLRMECWELGAELAGMSIMPTSKERATCFHVIIVLPITGKLNFPLLSVLNHIIHSCK